MVMLGEELPGGSPSPGSETPRRSATCKRRLPAIRRHRGQIPLDLRALSKSRSASAVFPGLALALQGLCDTVMAMKRTQPARISQPSVASLRGLPNHAHERVNQVLAAQRLGEERDRSVGETRRTQILTVVCGDHDNGQSGVAGR